VRFHRDDGSVLAADLVLAAAIVVVVSAVAAAFGTVAGALQDHREAARVSAVVAARTGDVAAAVAVAERLAPGSTVTIDDDGDEVTVHVTGPIEVPHPVTRRIQRVVSGEATVPIAPYRSNHG